MGRVAPPPTPPHNVADLSLAALASSFAATLRAVGHTPLCKRLGCAALPLALAFWLMATMAAAQTPWELSPTRVRIVVAVAARVPLDQTQQAALRSALAESADATFGARWKLEIEPAKAPLRDEIAQRIGTLANNLFAVDLGAVDKVLVVGVDIVPGGFLVAARDFDCQTQLWGPPVIHVVRQTAMLSAALFRTLLDAYAPVARIDFDEKHRVVLRPRAASLPAGDPSLQLFVKGMVFLPVLRHNDRDGNPRKGGIQPVPWTFLTIDQVGPAGIACSVHSGVRSPLRARMRGRIEQFALPVKTPPGPTQLLLRDRATPERPLVDYQVYARDPGSSMTIPLGKTDATGHITVMPGPGPLRMIYVRNGDSLLARVPVVPGWRPAVTVRILDDAARIRAEGFLSAIQARLMDVVARREILITRVRHLLSAGDLDAAQEQLDQLQDLPNRQRFLQEITQQQQRNTPSDPQLAAGVARLFDATKKLLAQFLDPRKINKLQSEYDRAQREKKGL
jgi:hypothetical protein